MLPCRYWQRWPLNRPDTDPKEILILTFRADTPSAGPSSGRAGPGSGRNRTENRPRHGHQKPLGGYSSGAGVNGALPPRSGGYSRPECNVLYKQGQRVSRPHPENLLPPRGSILDGFASHLGLGIGPRNSPQGPIFAPSGRSRFFSTHPLVPWKPTSILNESGSPKRVSV